MEHQTLGRRFICRIGPATEREFILDWRIFADYCLIFKFKSWMDSNAHKSQDADVRSSDMKRFLSMCTWPTNAMAQKWNIFIESIYRRKMHSNHLRSRIWMNYSLFFGQEHDQRKLLYFVNRQFCRAVIKVLSLLIRSLFWFDLGLLTSHENSNHRRDIWKSGVQIPAPEGHFFSF